MKLYVVLKITVLSIAVSFMSGCGTGGGNNPANLFNGAVFISDHDGSGADELFIADSEGVTVTKISDAAVPAGNVQSFLVSPNAGFIAYLSDQEDAGINELYYLKKSADTAGVIGVEAPVKINADLTTAGQGVTKYEWSPNGQLIAYIADQDTPGTFDLYVSDARSVLKVSSAITAGDDVVDFKWSPDSKYIAYTAPIAGGAIELHVSKPDVRKPENSVTAVQVSQSLSGTAPVDYEWAPLVLFVSNFIAYTSDQDRTEIDLYTTAVTELTSTANALANSTKVTDAATGSVQAFRWPNLNNTVLAFTAPLVTTGKVNLFTTGSAGSSVVAVSDVVTGGGVTDDFLWSPGNSLLAYVADQDDVGVFELYITQPVVASTGTKVSAAAMPPTGDVDNTDGFLWSRSGFDNQIIYRADQDTDEVFELYITTIVSGASTSIVKISGDDAEPPNAIPVGEEFLLSPFGTVVSYIAQETAGVNELFATNLLNNDNVLKVSSDFTDPNMDVVQHVWSADGTRILYVADESADEVYDVFSNLVNGTASLNLSTSPLNTDAKQGALVDEFGVSVDVVSP